MNHILGDAVGVSDDIFSVFPDPVNFLFRILLAAVLGFAIGFERKTRSKEAGIRTHTIVCMGASLIMIVSKYGFWDYWLTGHEYDGARVVAQVVSGIGFLGAGMIVYSKGTLHGLTTAAGIWATAGVGIAMGAGGNTMMLLAVVATVLILLVHLLLHQPLKIFRTKTTHLIQVQFKATEGALDRVKELFGTQSIFRMRIQNVDGNKIATVLLRTSNIPDDERWQEIMDENDFITSMEYSEQEW